MQHRIYFVFTSHLPPSNDTVEWLAGEELASSSPTTKVLWLKCIKSGAALNFGGASWIPPPAMHFLSNQEAMEATEPPGVLNCCRASSVAASRLLTCHSKSPTFSSSAWLGERKLFKSINLQSEHPHLVVQTQRTLSVSLCFMGPTSGTSIMVLHPQQPKGNKEKEQLLVGCEVVLESQESLQGVDFGVQYYAKKGSLKEMQMVLFKIS